MIETKDLCVMAVQARIGIRKTDSGELSQIIQKRRRCR